jgi:hypothetical protein
MGRSDSPSPVPPHFVAFARPVSRSHPRFAPMAAGCAGHEPGVGDPVPPPGTRREGGGASQVPGEPRYGRAPLSDPGGIARARPLRRRDAAFRPEHDVGSRACVDFGAQSRGPSTGCLSLRIQGQFFDFFGGMLAASLDNAISDHMDTIRRPDLSSANTCSSPGIAHPSGPIWDRADRVTQVCHLERIVPRARSPNWPYGRLDRAPPSVPLETTLGAPRGGAKTTCERWQDRSVASEDRNPVADNPPSSRNSIVW